MYPVSMTFLMGFSVDGLDLSVLGSNWQRHGLRADGDLNNDGTVDGVDLSMLGANWQTGVKRLT